MGAVGLVEKARLHGVLQQMAQAWQAARQQYPTAAPRLRVEFHGNGCAIHDWVDKLYTDGHHTAWLDLTATKLFQGKKVRPDKMLPYWLRSLAAAAAQPGGLPPQGWVVGQNAHLRIKPMDPEAAVQQLQQLLAVRQLGMSSPLPLPLVTAIKCLGKSGNPIDAYQGSEFQKVPGEVNDMYWARCYPDFETLWAARTSDGRSMKDLAQMLYQPLLDWVNTHVEAFLFDGDAGAAEEDGE
jgi:exodeoxyribonuclease V gamma subunit